MFARRSVVRNQATTSNVRDNSEQEVRRTGASIPCDHTDSGRDTPSKKRWKALYDREMADLASQLAKRFSGNG